MKQLTPTRVSTTSSGISPRKGNAEKGRGSVRGGRRPMSRIAIAKERIRLAAWLERRNLVLAGFGLASAVWARAVAPHAALLPLIALPVFVAGRYRSRQLGAVAAVMVAGIAAVLAHESSLELTLWHALVLAVVMAGLYVLAERATQHPTVNGDWFARLLYRTLRQNGEDISLVVDFDGFEELEAQYGTDAYNHVTNMLRRAIERESSSSDLVVRRADGQFVVMLQNSSERAAEDLLARIRRTFRRAADDAGYNCPFTISYTSVAVETDMLPTFRQENYGVF